MTRYVGLRTISISAHEAEQIMPKLRTLGTASAMPAYSKTCALMNDVKKPMNLKNRSLSGESPSSSIPRNFPLQRSRTRNTIQQVFAAAAMSSSVAACSMMPLHRAERILYNL